MAWHWVKADHVIVQINSTHVFFFFIILGNMALLFHSCPGGLSHQNSFMVKTRFQMCLSLVVSSVSSDLLDLQSRDPDFHDGPCSLKIVCFQHIQYSYTGVYL